MPDPDPLGRFRLKRCINCGYDLRGSRDSAKCPECGEHIEQALLISTPPRWDPAWPGTMLAALWLAMGVRAYWLHATGPRVGGTGTILALEALCLGLAIFSLALAWHPSLRHRRRFGSSAVLCNAHGFGTVVTQPGRSKPADLIAWGECIEIEIEPAGRPRRADHSKPRTWMLRIHASYRPPLHPTDWPPDAIAPALHQVVSTRFLASLAEMKALRNELERRHSDSRAVADAPDHP